MESINLTSFNVQNYLNKQAKINYEMSAIKNDGQDTFEPSSNPAFKGVTVNQKVKKGLFVSVLAAITGLFTKKVVEKNETENPRATYERNLLEKIPEELREDAKPLIETKTESWFSNPDAYFYPGKQITGNFAPSNFTETQDLSLLLDILEAKKGITVTGKRTYSTQVNDMLTGLEFSNGKVVSPEEVKDYVISLLKE